MPQTRRMVQTFFTLLLVAAFALLALFAVMTGANVYRNTAAAAEENYAARTSLLYVTEKLRQCGGAPCATVGTVGGVDALVLRQTVEGNDVLTYIYAADGALREVVALSGVAVNVRDGQPIMELSALRLSEANGLLTIQTEAADGTTARALYALNR